LLCDPVDGGGFAEAIRAEEVESFKDGNREP
jgi:hypothetical protein